MLTKMVIGKKSDAHDSKESPHFASQYKNWLSVSGEEDFFYFVNAFSLFCNYLPLEKGRTLYLNKLKSPSPKESLYHAWLKLTNGSGEEDFLNFVNIFCYFVIISPWKRVGPFI